LSDVVKRQRDFLKSSNLNNKKIYLFSDAQKSTFNILDVSSDTTIKTTVIPCATSQINNVFIDSCWFETPLQQKGFVQKLHASITNKGNARIDIGSAKLTLNKQQIAIASFSLDANSKNDIQFTFECKQNGFNYGSIKIEDYPITFDDELFFTFNSKLNISVALINGKETNTIANTFSSLFTGDSLFNFRSFSEQTIDYGVFKTSDVVILNQLTELSSGLVSELLKYSNQGGSIVIIPSSKLNLVLYNQAFSQLQLPALLSMDSTASKVDKIEVASKFYEGVFEKIEERLNLPLVNKHYKVQKNSHLDFESILLLQSGDPLLGKSKLNSASVYLFLAALNETSTNFNKHALFVPTFYQICFKSLKFVPLFYPVSDNVVINLKNDLSAQEQPPHIQQSDKLFDVIPEKRSINNSLFLYTQHQINQAGFYQIAQKDSVLLPLAFNFSRQESDLFCYGSDELEKIIADKGSKAFSFIEDTGSNISTLILQEAEGKKLWKLFIILTLFFIALEVTLLRLLK
jgi:hypothetical protein